MQKGKVMPVALLTIKEAAERLNLCQATVYELCAQRKLRHVRLGVGRGTIRVSEADLDQYLQEATVQPDEGDAANLRG